MKLDNQQIAFKKLHKNGDIPYGLLALADPSRELVDEYLKHSDVYLASQNETTLGVIVLCPLSAETIEIKNIAVSPQFQRQGVGRFLIDKAINIAALNKHTTIRIGTANSSIGQRYLYQKAGFELIEIKKDYFTDNYAAPIYENGVRAKHLLVLEKPL